MNKKKEVTVLMSMYNTPIEQLKEAIESILNQTYRDFEFLIIDDGSNKACVDLVKSYNDSRINLIQNKQNIGLEKSLNKGLKIAKGKYIVRMDTDDIAYPERIEKQIDFIEKHKEYSIVGAKADFFDENGIYGQNKKVGKIKKEDLLFGTPFMHPTLIMKKDDILKIGGYPLYKRCEDYAMEMELYAKGYKGYVMNELLIKYRMDNVGYKKKKMRDRFIETKMKIKYFKKLGVPVYKYFYAIKPIIAGLIPKEMMKKYQRRKLCNKKVNS